MVRNWDFHVGLSIAYASQLSSFLIFFPVGFSLITIHFVTVLFMLFVSFSRWIYAGSVKSVYVCSQRKSKQKMKMLWVQEKWKKNEWAQESMGFDIRCLVKGSELSFVIRWLLLELGLEIVCSLKTICAATPETWNVIELMWFAHDAIEHRTIRNNIDLVWQAFVSCFWCVCVFLYF